MYVPSFDDAIPPSFSKVRGKYPEGGAEPYFAA